MTQLKVNYTYEILLLLIQKNMHGREIAKKLKTSLTRIQSILMELRSINAVDYIPEGRNHVYFIKKNLIAKSFVLNAENYKLVRIMRKHQELEPLFQKVAKKSKSNLVLLFGSYAKNTETDQSDIDIYVKTTSQKIRDDVQKIYDLLNVKIGNFDTDSLLIKEIIKNHAIIKGGEEYYERIQFFK